MNEVIAISRDASPFDQAFREPPHSLEAEQAFLGGVMADNRVLDGAAFLKPEHFALAANGRLYEAILALRERGRVADPLTVKPLVENLPSVVEAGGVPYLVGVASAAVGRLNAIEYARLIRDLWVRREMIAVGQDIVAAGYTPDFDRDAMSIWTDAEARVEALAETKAPDEPGTLERLEEIYRNPGKLLGVSSGLTAIDNLLCGFQAGQLILLAGRPSMGKAQPLDARIKTVSGWKTMGEIAVGDAIASPDGRTSVVTGKFPQGQKKIYRMTFHDGRSAECCDDHLWLVYCKYFKEKHRIMPLREIRKLLSTERYANRLAIEPITGEFGDASPLPMPAYLLGVIIGDGALVNNFRIATADKEILDRCGALVADGYHLRHVAAYDYALVKKRRGGPSVYRDAVRALGLMGKPSNAKFIPPQYLAASYQDRLELMRGLLDTDGTVERDGTIRFSTVSRQLAHDMRELSWSLGAVVRVSERTPSYTHNGERRTGQRCYVVSIRHNSQSLLLTLPRKLCRLRPSLRRVRMRLVAATLEREAEACCISVSHPDGLYITDNYIPTHNTTLAAAMARKAKAGDDPAKVAFFTLEQSKSEIEIKIISDLASVPMETMRRGSYADAAEFGRVVDAHNRLRKMPLAILGRSGMTPAEIRATARQIKRNLGGLDMIVVDQLTHIAPPDKRTLNKVHQIGETLKPLKAMARELGVPVILLHQLSRGVEARENKRPTLQDLRDSGEIEQDADVVMFIYREAYYLERDEPVQPNVEDYDGPGDREYQAAVRKRDAWERNITRARTAAEVVVAKQRMGPIDTVTLYYDGRLSRFGDVGRVDG